MCKRWTLLIVRCAHTDINEAIPAFLDTRRAGTPRAEGLRRSPSPHIGAGDMKEGGGGKYGPVWAERKWRPRVPWIPRWRPASGGSGR